MIFSTTSDETTRALLVLEDATASWFPCGSRFFGDATESSDFDFFSDEPFAEEWLVEHGFKYREQKYRDVNTISVYTRGNVHAILVRSALDRLAAQQTFVGVPKHKRRSIQAWDSVYADISKKAEVA